MARRKKKGAVAPGAFIKYEISGLVLLAVAGLAIAGMGPVGKWFAKIFMYLAGNWYWLIGLMMIYSAVYLMVKRHRVGINRRNMGFWLLIGVILGMAHLSLYRDLTARGSVNFDMFRITSEHIKSYYDFKFQNITGSKLAPPDAGGGYLGYLLFLILHGLFDTAGAYFVLAIMFISSVILISGKSFVSFMGMLRGFLHKRWLKLRSVAKEAWELIQTEPEPQDKGSKTKREKHKPAQSSQLAAATETAEAAADFKIMDFTEQIAEHAAPERDASTIKVKLPPRPQQKPLDDAEFANSDPIVLNMGAQDESYEIPTLALLEPPYGGRSGGDNKDVQNNALKLQETLASFGVQVKVTEAHRGPTVTRYEVQPAVGVKVSRIVNLSDDLALALAAKDLRIEAPIPGKSAVGIEVPNREVAVVTLREVIESQEFQTSHSHLTVALGRDISGAPIIGNLSKMPHLLVAGSTGSGKSVCINGIITSIIYKAKPGEVKFIMVDPKMVELNVYNGIPHLLSPVVTDPRRAAYALKKVVQEMEHRYELFAKEGARNMEGYNALMTERQQPQLPFIVVIIDELADLMMVAPGDVEDAIIRLAQMARAAGIHLIIATQRPSVDVITGVIKANIPSRIAFAVSSQMDSRTILDMGGAEKLLGRGDMLYLPVGESKPIRVQGAFLSDTEVERVVTYVKEQQSVAYTLDLSSPKEDTVTDEQELDALFWDAVKLVVDSEQASVSLIQRRLKVGYARAARLVDQMEERGVVGPFEGSKPREVLITPDQLQNMLEE